MVRAAVGLLYGVEAIARRLDCTTDMVLVWKQRGAPIRAEGRGRGRRYWALEDALLAWLQEQVRTTPNSA